MNTYEIIKKYNIDTTKLKRDYITFPICKHKIPADMPFYEDLKYLYIDCLVSYTDLYKYFFQVSHGLFDKWLQTFNIKRPVEYKNNLREQTALLKFGVKSCMQVPEIQTKQKETLLQKYGVYNISQLDEIKFKKINTEHKNNSFGKSKNEEEIYRLLVLKFNIINRQYYNKVKYPWKCDFFIPQLDLYIEYQGHWTHGEGKCHEPYDPNKKEHQQILKRWKAKAITNRMYNDAINTWTIRDPLKRETALQNGLNWLEFFTMDEFYIWYNQQ